MLSVSLSKCPEAAHLRDAFACAPGMDQQLRGVEEADVEAEAARVLALTRPPLCTSLAAVERAVVEAQGDVEWAEQVGCCLKGLESPSPGGCVGPTVIAQLNCGTTKNRSTALRRRTATSRQCKEHKARHTFIRLDLGILMIS